VKRFGLLRRGRADEEKFEHWRYEGTTRADLQERSSHFDRKLLHVRHAGQAQKSAVSIETYYNPARTIGGDFGVVFPHTDEALSILMCDVSGHGIGSALMANRIYSETLHQLKRNAGPSAVLRRVHEFVHDRLAIDTFYFTMAAVRFTMRGRRATFAAAGHPPAMLVSNGRVQLLESQNGTGRHRTEFGV
jgi:serine phosphatase RsbU (regulator of sigma subunit)